MPQAVTGRHEVAIIIEVLILCAIAAYCGTQYGRYRAAQDCDATGHFAGGGMAFTCAEYTP